jgi:serine protease Do
MRPFRIFLVLLAVSALSLLLSAPQLFAAPPAPLAKALADTNAAGATFWVYNDLDTAFAEAKRQNKPLFVTFRCVPCAACKSFDASVASGSDIIEKLAREHFVAVRQVEMKGVDLSRFQFDHDLNWAAMFLNPDGTVYGRYGTQSADGPDSYNSIASLEKAMRRVLDLHLLYPANQPGLAPKSGPRKPWTTALDMPGLNNRDKLARPTEPGNCIHCHMIHDAENRQAVTEGTYQVDLLNRYPLPDDIGLVIDPDDGTTIEAITPDSPASSSGLKPGDQLLAINNQPIISIADIQFILHHSPKPGARLTLRAQRNNTPLSATIDLPDGWKQTDWSWRGSNHSAPPILRTWTPPLTPEELKRHGLPPGTHALLVKWINTGSKAGKANKAAGLREGDVILEIDDQPIPGDHKHFNAHLKTHYQIGDSLPLTILRKGKRIPLELPLVE